MESFDISVFFKAKPSNSWKILPSTPTEERNPNYSFLEMNKKKRACPHGENWKINQKVISSESSPLKYAYISISGSFLKQKNGVKPKHPRFKEGKKNRKMAFSSSNTPDFRPQIEETKKKQYHILNNKHIFNLWWQKDQTKMA